jgi:hypothetical protein
MRALVTGGAGFLLAVLWFDLMFDVQVIPHRKGELPPGVVSSISTYYRRVTTDAGRMSRLVVVFMGATLLGIASEIVHADGAPVARWLSLVLAAVPIGIAGTRTVPRAIRLGTARDLIEWQAGAARTIYVEHVCCFCSIASVLVVQLAWMG